LQTIVTLSTTEAEYIGSCSGWSEISMVVESIFRVGIQDPRMHPPSILTINLLSLLQRTLSIMDASSILDLRFYWLQDIVDSGQISVVHAPLQDACRFADQIIDTCQSWLMLRHCLVWRYDESSNCWIHLALQCYHHCIANPQLACASIHDQLLHHLSSNQHQFLGGYHTGHLQLILHCHAAP